MCVSVVDMYKEKVKEGECSCGEGRGFKLLEKKGGSYKVE